MSDLMDRAADVLVQKAVENSVPRVDYEDLWDTLSRAVKIAHENDPEAVISLGTLAQMLSGMHDTAQLDATAHVRERLASL